MVLPSSLPSKPKENRVAGSHRTDSPQSRGLPLSLSTAPASTLKALVGVGCRKAQHHCVGVSTYPLAHHHWHTIGLVTFQSGLLPGLATRCAEAPPGNATGCGGLRRRGPSYWPWFNELEAQPSLTSWAWSLW